MKILFTILFTIIVIVVCIAIIILMLGLAISLFEETKFGEWLLQKIKSKWERE